MDRKVKLATRVDPATAQILRDRAALHQLSLSEAAAELLVGAVKSVAVDGSSALLFAELKHLLHRDMARIADRLAHLLVRAALEAGATRREVFNLLLRSGLPPEAAKQIHEAAWQATVAALRKPIAAIDDLARPHGEPSEESIDAAPR